MSFVRKNGSKTDLNFSIVEELEIVLVKRFNVESHAKGHLAYMSQKKVKLSTLVCNLKILLINLQ